MVIILFTGYSCNQRGQRIKTPYGLVFKSEELNTVTDEEIEYFLIDEEFIYMFKKDEDIATYIIPTKNVKLIAPLKKNVQEEKN